MAKNRKFIFHTLITCLSIFSSGFVVCRTLTRSLLNSCDILFDYSIGGFEIMQ